MFRLGFKRSYLAAYVLALAGTALKVLQWYHSRPLWLDEQMVLLNARDRNVSQLAGALWFDQAAPLGWLALQRSALLAFGTGDRAVRALPVLFGVATLWACCWMARRWMTPFAAAVFVALCGIGQWITFYALEAKPYSADAFWALLLPALAVWAAEPADERPLQLRRTGVWWGAATLAQWFSFGAMFATPACALLLCAVAWRRSGTRAAVIVAAQGSIWLLCFAAHYTLSISAPSSDEFLRTFWAGGFPPSGSAAGALGWLAAQAEPLAAHPGGAMSWTLFWSTAAYGIAVALVKAPVLGLVLLSIPLSAALLAMLHVVPLADRLALWTTPATYAAIAIAAGDIFTRVHAGVSRRSYAPLLVAVPFSVGALMVSGEIVALGRERVIVRGSNHGLDDGRGIRMLMRQRQSGDVFLTTHFGLPALWWYADMNLANDGSRFPDGAPVLEIKHVDRGVDGCQNRARLSALSEALAGRPRALVYLGFGSNVPPGFQQMVLDDLSELGTRTFYTAVASEGVAAVFDLRAGPGQKMEAVSKLDRRASALEPRPSGCVGMQPARTW